MIQFPKPQQLKSVRRKSNVQYEFKMRHTIFSAGYDSTVYGRPVNKKSGRRMEEYLDREK